ncbi:hypothetical protein Tco_1070288 [Tanacetum coccineum]|uniref:Uncharacterized protein n=1 Tax=Tanacetum coccineum TaxID=301880 RepID=A0ABQ5HMD1_9ASTR
MFQGGKPFLEKPAANRDEDWNTTNRRPKPTLEDEFHDLHLNLLVLEVLAHVPIYNTMLDKYMERSLPKPYNQSPPLESSSKEKAQGKSSTWTTSTTLLGRVTSSLATRLINKEKRFLGGNPMNFFKENEKKIFSEAGDGIRIYLDGVVIFDEKKLGSS